MVFPQGFDENTLTPQRCVDSTQPRPVQAVGHRRARSAGHGLRVSADVNPALRQASYLAGTISAQ